MSAEAGPRPVVDLVFEDGRWKEAGLAARAEAAVRAALAEVGLDPDRAEVSVLAAGDARIAELNRAYRGKEGPTNVLSWPAFAGATPEAVAAAIGAGRTPPGERVLLGDVALAYETCAAEAAERSIPLPDHAAHLVVHAVLHLLGYGHEDEGEAARMEALETKSLATLGVPDPYRR